MKSVPADPRVEAPTCRRKSCDTAVNRRDRIGVLTGGAINRTSILQRNILVRGIYVRSRQMFQAMNAAIRLPEIHPVIDRVFPFEQAREAYHYMKGQQHVGKVVIRIA